MSSSIPNAFVLSSSFIPQNRNFKSSTCSRPHISQRRITVAVLDTPASNSYLQQHAEVVLRDFLTKRAVHTVMYYMEELGDSPSKSWLKKFDNFSQRVGQDDFKDGDGYLQRMMAARNEKGILKIKHSRAYLSRTFHFVIEPHRIAKRVYDAREQLASEWAHDLLSIEDENLELQRMSFEKLLTTDQKVLAAKQNLVFDSDPMSSDHSPLRYKNYIALKTLTTQHAVARLLPFIRDHGPNHEYMYLLTFVNNYGPIENGDAFIQQLMSKPVETRTHPDHLIQPLALANQLLETRFAIAQEWINVMEFIPQERALMNRSILENSMQMSHSLGEDIPIPKKSDKDNETETSLEADGDKRDHSI